jgi:hypothetical protein
MELGLDKKLFEQGAIGLKNLFQLNRASPVWQTRRRSLGEFLSIHSREPLGFLASSAHWNLSNLKCETGKKA